MPDECWNCPDTRERLTIEADRRQPMGARRRGPSLDDVRGVALSLWLADELEWELFAGPTGLTPPAKPRTVPADAAVLP